MKMMAAGLRAHSVFIMAKVFNARQRLTNPKS